MSTASPPRRASLDDADQRIVLHGISWTEYEIMLAIRGERPVPRMTYLRGELELMSPSRSHEWIKKSLARLVEVWAVERRVPLVGLGSWTVRQALKQRGIEPDECYALSERHDRPDIAIEVIWTSPLIDKLEVYRGLGVPEVWIWEAGRIRIHLLQGESYVDGERSALLPEAPLEAFARYLERADTDQAQAVFDFVDELRAGG